MSGINRNLKSYFDLYIDGVFRKTVELTNCKNKYAVEQRLKRSAERLGYPWKLYFRKQCPVNSKITAQLRYKFHKKFGLGWYYGERNEKTGHVYANSRKKQLIKRKVQK